MSNSNQIDNTSYYLLPCGRYLEDFIWWRGLNFAWGSALKYYWRAGRKDGESKDKDTKKYMHYVFQINFRTHVGVDVIKSHVRLLASRASKWDGIED